MRPTVSSPTIDCIRRIWIWTPLVLLGAASMAALLTIDDRTRSLAWNTLFLAAGTCAISLPLGTVLAWLLVRTDLPGRRAALVLLGVLVFVPLYLQAAAWQAGFGIQGWYTLSYGATPWLEGFSGAVWVHAMAALPWVVLVVGAGFWLVEPELEEQALLDGSAAQVSRHVTLSTASGTVGIAALWVVIVTAGEITVTDLFMVRTYAEELFTRLAMGEGPAEALRGMAPGVVATAWLVVAGLALLAKLSPPDRPISLQRRYVFRLRSWRVPMAVLVVAALLLLVGIPLGNLCYKAGVVVAQTDTGRLRTWSAWKCLEIVGESPLRYRRDFGWSLGISGLAATGATAAAILLAWIARAGRLRAQAVILASAVCLALPGPVIGMGVIGLLNRPEVPLLVYLYDHSILAPWLTLFLRGLAPATLIMWHALRTVPTEMLDAASVDGAGPIGRLVRIALPCRLTALALAWVVALAVALGDLAASILVVPPGVTTLSIRIFGLLHYGVEDQVAGICLVLAAIFALVAGSAAWLVRRWSLERARQ